MATKTFKTGTTRKYNDKFILTPKRYSRVRTTFPEPISPPSTTYNPNHYRVMEASLHIVNSTASVQNRLFFPPKVPVFVIKSKSVIVVLVSKLHKECNEQPVSLQALTVFISAGS